MFLRKLSEKLDLDNLCYQFNGWWLWKSGFYSLFSSLGIFKGKIENLRSSTGVLINLYMTVIVHVLSIRSSWLVLGEGRML